MSVEGVYKEKSSGNCTIPGDVVQMTRYAVYDTTSNWKARYVVTTLDLLKASAYFG